MENLTVLQGRFTRKPEVTDAGGFSLCDFTIAWSNKYGDNEKKCFLRCKAWRGLAEHIAKHFDKGQECIVRGELTTEEWVKDGQKQSMNVLSVEKINFCGSKNNNSTPVAATEKNDFMDIPKDIAEELPFN